MISLLVLCAACTDYQLNHTTEGNDVDDDGDSEPLVDGDADTDADSDSDSDTGVIEEPVAEAPIYAQTSTELFEVDPVTGKATRIGAFRAGGRAVVQFLDIAIDMGGRMYGGSSDTGDNDLYSLYTIDPTDASVTWFCDTDIAPYALAFTSSGALFAGSRDGLFRVDLGSCRGTPVVGGHTYETSGDLVGLPDGYLYWTVRGSNGDELVRVDPDSGAANWIGRIGVERLYGVGYDEVEGMLYGFSSSGEIVSINPQTAQSRVLHTANVSWWGATTNPVVW